MRYPGPFSFPPRVAHVRHTPSPLLSPKRPPLSLASPAQSSGRTPFPHVARKRRMRPVAHTPHEAMLYGIEMDVIDVAREVVFVADRVLPEAPLPKCEIANRLAPHWHLGFEQRAADSPLDPPPAAGVIGT